MQNVSTFWEMLTTCRTLSKSSQKFFFCVCVCDCVPRNNICECVWEGETKCVGMSCVQGFCESVFCVCACLQICVCVCVCFPPVPEGGCWITGPFWQAGTLRAVSPLARPGMSSEKNGERKSDRERGEVKEEKRERRRRQTGDWGGGSMCLD